MHWCPHSAQYPRQRGARAARGISKLLDLGDSLSFPVVGLAEWNGQWEVVFVGVE